MNNPKEFTWVGATERTDGTPYDSTERRGYNVYIYPAGESPTEVTFAAISQENDFTMPVSDLGNPLDEGDYEMVVTELPVKGRESDYSVPITFSIVVANPKPPTGLTAS